MIGYAQEMKRRIVLASSPVEPAEAVATIQRVVLVTGFEEAVYQALLLVAGVLCLGVAAYAWRYRERRVAKLLIVLLLADVQWIAMAWVVVQFAGQPVAKVATRAWFLGVTVSVACLLLLALQYTGREEYVGKTSAGLLALPVVLTNVAVWVPPLQESFFSFGPPDPSTFYGYAAEAGPLFYVHVTYSYLLTLAAAVLFVGFAVRSEQLYQRQVTAILVAVFTPWVGNALFVSGVTTVDLTPVSYAVVGLALWWAIFQEDLLEVVPVARSAVVDNIDAGVFVFDRNDRLVDVNPTGRELLGLEGADVIGRDAGALLDGLPTLRERFESVADTAENIETEVSFGADHFQVSISPLTDRRGQPIGRLFLVNDVTEQKRRQRELERQNEQLEEFASVVSHDLRNPLSVAASNLELGRMRSEGGEEYLTEAERAIDRMDGIIDDVLTLAREGRGIETVERTSLSSLAERAWQNVETDAATLTVVDDRELEADSDRLQRAFENLFRNAVEHGGDGVTVRVGERPDGFYVEDDGPGIPPEHRAEVFENGFTTAETGTGFGLAIVETIVAAHGWEIAVAADAADGARFEVSGVAPLATRDPTEDTTDRAPGHDDESLATDGEGDD